MWAFCSDFGRDLGLWPFTAAELVSALRAGRGRLLTELHLVLLRFVLSDVDDAIDQESGELVLMGTLAAAQAAVTSAPRHRMDPRHWLTFLNELTWPEVMRQLAVCAAWEGRGPKAAQGTWVEAFATKEYIEVGIEARVEALSALLSNAMSSGPVREVVERRETIGATGKRLMYLENQVYRKRDREEASAGRAAAAVSAEAKAAHDALLRVRRRQRAARNDAVAAIVREFATRVHQLGVDRRHNSYFVAASPHGQGSSLYVALQAAPAVDEGAERVLEIADEAGLDALLEALEPRGVHEGELREALLKEAETLRPAMRASAYALASAERTRVLVSGVIDDGEADTLAVGRAMTRASETNDSPCALPAGTDIPLEYVRAAALDMQRALPPEGLREGWDFEGWRAAVSAARTGGDVLEALSVLEGEFVTGWVSLRLLPAPGAPRVDFVVQVPPEGEAVDDGAGGADGSASGGDSAAEAEAEAVEPERVEIAADWPATTSAAAALRLFLLDYAVSYSSDELSALDSDERFATNQPCTKPTEGAGIEGAVLSPEEMAAAQAAEEEEAARAAEEAAERARERKLSKRGVSLKRGLKWPQFPEKIAKGPRVEFALPSEQFRRLLRG